MQQMQCAVERKPFLVECFRKSCACHHSKPATLPGVYRVEPGGALVELWVNGRSSIRRSFVKNASS